MTTDSTNVAIRLEEQLSQAVPKEGLRNFIVDANREGLSQIEVNQLINGLPSQARDSITLSSMGNLQDNPLQELKASQNREGTANDQAPAAVEKISGSDRFFQAERGNQPKIIGDTSQASQTGFVRDIDEHGNLHQHNLDGTHTITTPSQRLQRLQHLTSTSHDTFPAFSNRHKDDLQYYYYGSLPHATAPQTAEREPVESVQSKRPSMKVLSDVVLAPGAMVGALTDRPFSLVSVHDLKIDRQDGSVVLVTNNGTALVKPNGAPVTAQELGKFMHSDGSIAVAPHGQPIVAGSLHDFGPSPAIKSAPDEKSIVSKTEQEKTQIYGPPMFTNYVRKINRSTLVPPPPIGGGATESEATKQNPRQNMRLLSRPLRQIINSMKKEPAEPEADAAANETTPQPEEKQPPWLRTNPIQSKDETPKGFEQREIARRVHVGQSQSPLSADPDQNTAHKGSVATGGGTSFNANPDSIEAAASVDAHSLLDDFQLDGFEIVFNTTPGSA